MIIMHQLTHQTFFFRGHTPVRPADYPRELGEEQEYSSPGGQQHDKCVICEADHPRSSRQVYAQEIVVHDVPNEWTHP